MAVKTITMRVCFCKKKKNYMSPQVRVRLYTSPSIRNTFGHYNRHSSLFFLKEPDWTYLHSSKLTGFLWPNYYINTNHAVSEQKQMKQVWNFYLKCKLLKTFIPFMR